jgi:hypothetical protein
MRQSLHIPLCRFELLSLGTLSQIAVDNDCVVMLRVSKSQSRFTNLL